MNPSVSRSTGSLWWRGPGGVLLVLAAIITPLFVPAWLPGHTLFSNDGPLGTLLSEPHRMPEWFRGGWQDLNSIGFREGGAWPGITYLLLWVLGPVAYSKLYAPTALLILGAGAWCCFRQMRLAPAACLLGGLAAMLNSGFFSAACWGVAAHPIALGLNFLALALLADRSSQLIWVRLPLAGLAVGMGVAEAADIGMLFSICTGVFIFYQAWAAPGWGVRPFAAGLGKVAVVAAFALWIAIQPIAVLVRTQIQGAVGMQQDAETRARRWDEATQWSLPKREALGLVIPGVFGYRMIAPREGSNYWGAAGRDAAWDRWFAGGKTGPAPDPNSQSIRSSGGGNYAGVLVVLVAIWAVGQSLRKEKSLFGLEQRRLAWFWAGTAVVCLLLAFGRYAPFYQLVYALPYASVFRNPAKFIHLVNWSLVILFAFGMDAVSRHFMTSARTEVRGANAALSRGWRAVSRFDRGFLAGGLVVLVICLAGWYVYGRSRGRLEAYLEEVLFDPGTAQEIAAFSVRQVGLFIFTFVLALSFLALVLMRWVAGKTALWGGLLAGVLLVGDFYRADRPWVLVWDYETKYASNPVIDRLRDQPWTGRVAVLPWWIPEAFRAPQRIASQQDFFQRIYHGEWKQQLFPYYNIQTLDVVQMRAIPEDLDRFQRALAFRGTQESLSLVTRSWQLTSTRYLLGPGALIELLNQAFDPVQRRFRIVFRFNEEPKPGVLVPESGEDYTAVISTNGMSALFEFSGALPRAALYEKWESTTNDTAALERIASAAFDPEKEVLVSGALPPCPNSVTNQASGPVKIVSYASKRIMLEAEPKRPAVLLLNDRFDPNWKVWVDGKPAELLRCNYIMRGVLLEPGRRQIEFRFEPPMALFYVSLAAVVFGLMLCGVLLVGARAARAETRGPSGQAP